MTATPFHDDPFAAYYNLDGVKTWSLTSDIDWAPEYAIEDLLTLIEGFGVPVTAFATHDSSVLRQAPSWVETGLHPDNTRPDPVHGLSRKVLDLKALYPDSVGIRAHRNFFGQNIAHLAAQAGLTYDVSVLLWSRPYGQAFRDQYGLWRMTYNWEDGVHADLGLDWKLGHVPIDGPGLKIFNCHPIFIYLNCPNDDYRRAIVKDFANLQLAPKSVLEPAIYKGYGARDFLRDLLTEMRDRGTRAVRLDNMVADAMKRLGA